MEIKTKYDIGEVVYIIERSKIRRAEIGGIAIAVVEENMKISYHFSLYPTRPEDECFRTKDELINHLTQQIS